MAMKKRERALAIFFATLFIIGALALPVAIIISNIQNRNKDNGAASQQATTATSSNKGGTMLQGTQLENFTPVATVDQLQSTDLTVGTGQEAKASDTVTVDYTGAIASTGKIFQSSKDSGQPISFGLNQVIKGWTEGVPGMKVGGTRRLLIPAALAYGSSSPSADIPANSDLVFDITLHSIGK